MNIQRPKTEWKYGTRVFEAGGAVFHEGDLGAEAYIVESGAVEIRKFVDGNPDGLVLGTLTQGAVFGEMALVDDLPRMGSAICTEHSVLRAIPVDVFESKIQQADPFIRAIVRVLVRNARSNASAGADAD